MNSTHPSRGSTAREEPYWTITGSSTSRPAAASTRRSKGCSLVPRVTRITVSSLREEVAGEMQARGRLGQLGPLHVHALRGGGDQARAQGQALDARETF